MVNNIELEAHRYGCEQDDTKPLCQFRQTAVFDFLTVEENDKCGDDKDHILEECRFVGHLNHVAEAAAVLHHPEIVDALHLKIFGDGEPHCQEEEEGHEDEIAPSGPLHLDPEEHHAAQDKLACDGHHGGEKRQRMQESHVKGDEIVVHRHPKAHRVNGFRETGEQEQAP